MDIREYITNNREFLNDHGIDHFDRVFEHGLKLAACEGGNKNVIKCFAYLHDACRMNEVYDPDHGLRAADYAETLRHSVLSYLTDKEFDQLITACKFHTNTLKTDDITVNCCFDADRLDLIRLNIKLDPNKFATATGREVAEKLNQVHIKKRVRLFRGGVTNEEFDQQITNKLWTSHFRYAEVVHSERLTQDLIDGISQPRKLLTIEVDAKRIKKPLIPLSKYDIAVDEGVNISECEILREDDYPPFLALPTEPLLFFKYVIKFYEKFGREELRKAREIYNEMQNFFKNER